MAYARQMRLAGTIRINKGQESAYAACLQKSSSLPLMTRMKQCGYTAPVGYLIGGGLPLSQEVIVEAYQNGKWVIIAKATAPPPAPPPAAPPVQTTAPATTPPAQTTTAPTVPAQTPASTDAATVAPTVPAPAGTEIAPVYTPPVNSTGTPITALPAGAFSADSLLVDGEESAVTEAKAATVSLIELAKARAKEIDVKYPWAKFAAGGALLLMLNSKNSRR